MHNNKKPTDARTLVQLKAVTLTIDNTPVLKNIDLTLPLSGVTAIMGFNGAGKSMLLKCIHGIVKPDQGEIAWTASNGESAEPQQSMVFQKPVLLRRTVAANIGFALKKTSLSNRDRNNHQQINQLLDSVNLLNKRDMPARLLSGGEQQRLALVRAVAAEPDVLFLDEATASLDPASTAIIEQLVTKQAQTGTAIIMVTHNSAQAQRLASQVVFMHHGTVLDHSAAKPFFTGAQSRVASAYLSGQLFNDSYE